MARRPGWWLFGLVPAVIVVIAYGGVLTALLLNADDLAGWVTPFADGWSADARRAMRLIAGAALIGAGAFLALLTFTFLTLLVGEPFYERIAVKVEETQGGAPPEPDVPLWTKFWRMVRNSALLGLLALCLAIVFFVLGFVPLLGQTVVPLVAIAASGYLLAGSLAAFALERRGLGLRDRFAFLRSNRSLAVGFGAATLITFIIPLGAILMMPAAVVGGTLMVRECLAGHGAFHEKDWSHD
jgi:CysZ protein